MDLRFDITCGEKWRIAISDIHLFLQQRTHPAGKGIVISRERLKVKRSGNEEMGRVRSKKKKKKDPYLIRTLAAKKLTPEEKDRRVGREQTAKKKKKTEKRCFTGTGKMYSWN